MEKYSAYRDPGTGIQPFIPPVPAPGSSDLIAKFMFPVAILLGAVRTLMLAVILLFHLIFVSGFCSILIPIGPLYRLLTRILTSITARIALFILGFLWIPVEQVSRKRGKNNNTSEPWNPKAGDVIVSNHVSWIELLWLAFRFNPVFVVPVAQSVPQSSASDSVQSSPISFTPGRRTGTGSANISSSARVATPRVPIIGFRTASLLSSIRLTGQVPRPNLESPARSLENIIKSESRPIVVFPECTTSNGRGLMRFAEIFHKSLPVKEFQVFVLCVRYDPPTTFAPTLSQSIPSLILNPLGHIFSVASALSPPSISIRLLNPSESPSSPLFIVSDVVTESGNDQLAEVCATLIAQLGKMKRMGLGWEEKASFLDLYRAKRKK
ncbi:hypothetical protein C8J56DRAFT_934846 [Mycena floridula]|nr:hypothetical protein C8J56DRAFT_934846 [Mycena floridula]